MKVARSIVLVWLALYNVTGASLRSDRGKLLEQEPNDEDAEDFVFWNRFLQNQNSFPTPPPTDPPVAPTNPPVAPTDPPVAPTDPPVAPVTPSPTPPPVADPTPAPEPNPTPAPVVDPTPAPVVNPTPAPVVDPTPAPAVNPTPAPVVNPTPAPEPNPTPAPVVDPTPAPEPSPTPAPVVDPTPAPVADPTPAPVADPTPAPVSDPTPAPVPDPTPAPVPDPTPAPVTPAPVPDPTPAPVTPAPTPAMAPTVQVRLTPFALEGGAEWEDPETCQSKALERTEEQEGADGFTDAKLVQYYALYCIWNCTNMVPNPITDANEDIIEAGFIPGWLLSRGWTATNLDPCADGWFGITCANDQVTEIQLANNVLTGNFPAEVKLLAADGPFATGAGNLNRLDLFNNVLLFNDFDNSWMTDLGSNMRFLFFARTGFSGDLVPLPANLEEFDCSFTFINGGFVDSTFAGLNELVFAELSGNVYNQAVPLVLGSLPRLEELYISEAFVTGDLSYLNGGMPAVIQHWIDLNPELMGTIPTAVGAFSTLQSFSLTFNGLSGPLPTEIGNLFFLQFLWLYGNQLSGQIPSEYGQIETLRLLRLESNDFTGFMPDEICANVGPFSPLMQLGADCEFPPEVVCECCHCCSFQECFAMFDLA